MVTEFVGFVGSYQHPGSLDPLAAGVLGAIVATWATFAPCFLWIFLGAPFIEQLRGNQRLAMGLTTITAAVVGVVLNLAVWFAVNTLFTTVTSARSWVAPSPSRSGHRLTGSPWRSRSSASSGSGASDGTSSLFVIGSAVAGLVYTLVR